ncbi:MAG TPA: hypothetical protein VKN37_04595, partial [Roseovarius sp.]|nr:hypothetical protein [Roseovarius sp.]
MQSGIAPPATRERGNDVAQVRKIIACASGGDITSANIKECDDMAASRLDPIDRKILAELQA